MSRLALHPTGTLIGRRAPTGTFTVTGLLLED